jgi:hypothetical protein
MIGMQSGSALNDMQPEAVSGVLNATLDASRALLNRESQGGNATNYRIHGTRETATTQSTTNEVTEKI